MNTIRFSVNTPPKKVTLESLDEQLCDIKKDLASARKELDAVKDEAKTKGHFLIILLLLFLLNFTCQVKEKIDRLPQKTNQVETK